MQRKVILMGGKTYVISLPAQWIRKYGVQKGQALHLSEEDNMVMVSTEQVGKLRSLKLNLADANVALLVRKLTMAYQLGYEELELSFPEKLSRSKDGMLVSTMGLVEDTCDQLIGFEVLNQSETHCIITDVAGRDINEFKNVLRRCFLMLNSFGQDSFLAITDHDVESLRELHRKHIAIRKFISYLQRYLNLKGVQGKTVPYHELVLGLLEISRTYRFVTKVQEKELNPYDPSVLAVFQDVVNLQEKFYELFYSYSVQDAQLLVAARMQCIHRINALSEELKGRDLILLHRLPNILNTLYSLLSVTIAVYFGEQNV